MPPRQFAFSPVDPANYAVLLEGGTLLLGVAGAARPGAAAASVPPGVAGFAWSPDGRQVAAAHEDLVTVLSADKQAPLFSARVLSQDAAEGEGLEVRTDSVRWLGSAALLVSSRLLEGARLGAGVAVEASHPLKAGLLTTLGWRVASLTM